MKNIYKFNEGGSSKIQVHETKIVLKQIEKRFYEEGRCKISYKRWEKIDFFLIIGSLLNEGIVRLELTNSYLSQMKNL